MGTPPPTYQWFKNGVLMEGGTNRTLVFQSVDFTNAGVYAVRVQNSAGIVWSLGATLVVSNAIDGGGLVRLANRITPVVNAPVFDVDTTTRLDGSTCLAQLYGGQSHALIRPVGEPSTFRAGFNAGYFLPRVVTLPTVPPGSNAVLQVRAWDGNKGSSYEEARALGGRFGKSEFLVLPVGGGHLVPAELWGLRSFSLQAGRPQFASGSIAHVGEQSGGIHVWSHQGEAGFRYVIEKSDQGFEWRPYLVITNVASTATFTDTPTGGSAFYRSRILD